MTSKPLQGAPFPRFRPEPNALSSLALNCASSKKTAPTQICSDQTRIPRWKRALDIAGVLLAAPVSIPLALVLALIVKSVSRGPILFKQKRIGYLGQAFPCLKFRTMVVDADTGVHAGHLN